MLRGAEGPRLRVFALSLACDVGSGMVSYVQKGDHAWGGGRLFLLVLLHLLPMSLFWPFPMLAALLQICKDTSGLVNKLRAPFATLPTFTFSQQISVMNNAFSCPKNPVILV